MYWSLSIVIFSDFINTTEYRKALLNKHNRSYLWQFLKSVNAVFGAIIVTLR